MENRLPSHSTVAAYLALFIALAGGTAYAVDTIGSEDVIDDSLRSRDLRNGGIRSGDVRNDNFQGSLRGIDLVESTLGQVPDADTVDGQDASDFVPAEGAAFISVGLPDHSGVCTAADTTWVNQNPESNARAGYYRDHAGFVRLEGFVKECSTGGIFELPAGYRPAGRSRQAVVTDDPEGFAELQVESSGSVHIKGVSDIGREVSLEGITFRCGPAGAGGCP